MLNVDCVAFLYKRAVPIFEQVHSNNVIKFYLVRSRAINFGRQCHFKIWLNCHKFKKCPCLIMPISTRCQKHEKKMAITVIQHDNRLTAVFTNAS
jgi:hypothetical protein